MLASVHKQLRTKNDTFDPTRSNASQPLLLTLNSDAFGMLNSNCEELKLRTTKLEGIGTAGTNIPLLRNPGEKARELPIFDVFQCLPDSPFG